MSCHKHNFHCFTAVGGEDSHKSSVPFEHHTPWLPRIPQHGMVAYQELEHGCCLCSAYQQAQTLEAVENQLLPFYHPYHNHPPHQYVLRGPSMHERTHSAKESNIHHRIHDKKIVLVKNSDPSFRKTISLHSKGLHSFGLFLKEVSELMEYHVRKLYTQEGFKIDSIQSLLQCPGVLVCVGREPSHPMIMENFEKTSSNKLPRLSGKSRTTEPTDGDETITAKTNITLPNLEDVNRGTKYSVSSDKSAPDGRDSPEIVNSCPASGDSIREDDIEKWVRVNKDGSLSMEMKVRFRLPNDKILHWSTKVKKTAGQNNDQIKGHNNPNLAHIGDVSCSVSEITSTDEAFFTQHVPGHREKPHCPYCCSQCQGYETWKNVIGKHGASRCSHSSSSSASSHTVVSRKTVIERQTMSRSSEEHADQLVETRMQSIEAAEMVFCTVQRETCLPKCNVKPSIVENGKSTGLGNCSNNFDLKTDKEFDQEEQTEEKGEGNDESSSQICNSDKKETMGSKTLGTDSLKSSRKHTKPKTSKPSYICHCGESTGPQVKLQESIKNKAGENDEIQRDKCSVMSMKSDASCRSNRSETNQTVESIEERGGFKSAMSANLISPRNCSSAVSDDTTEGLQACDEKEEEDRASSKISMKSFKSSKSVKAPPVRHESEEDVEQQAEDDLEPRTQSLLSALSSESADLKGITQETSEEEDNQNTGEEIESNSVLSVKSAISEISTVSKGSSTSEGIPVDNQAAGGIRPSCMSATSERSTVSQTSRMSPSLEETSERATSALSTKSNLSTKSKKTKTTELYVTKKSNIPENDNPESESKLRPQSKLSVNSEKSVKSNVSAKSSKSQKSEVVHNNNSDNMKEDNCNITEIPDTAKTKASSVISEKSVSSTSVTPTKQNACKEDRTTIERAGSAMSVKSGKSHTSVISLKSEPSQVFTSHPGNIDNERNHLHASEGRSSSMSDKSIKSNISAKSSKTKGCEKLDECDAANGEQGPGATLLKSVQSHIKTESILSKPPTKSNMSKTSDGSTEGSSSDQDQCGERALSNMSAASAKSSKSHASVACAKKNVSEICCSPTEEIFSEEEIEGRSVSSTSVQSVKTNISSRSSRSNCSAHAMASEGTELLFQYSEEMKPEKRAACSASTKSVESQNVRSASVMSKTSTKSNISTQSTKSNTLDVSSRPGQHTNEQANQERVPSVLSVKSTNSATSTKSTKSKCSNKALQEKSSNTYDQENDQEERPQSRGSVISERSAVSAERPHSNHLAKSKVSDVESDTSDIISDEGHCEDEAEQRAHSALSNKTAISTTSAKSTKSAEHVDLYENISNNGEKAERALSNISTRSEKSTQSKISNVSTSSKIDGLEGVHHEETDVEQRSEFRPISQQSIDSICSIKSNKSMRSAIAEVDDSSLDSEEEKHENNGEERSPSSMSGKSVQSCMSEISIKSLERTPRSLSGKSVKLSSERSASCAKSSKSNRSDHQADENMVGDYEDVETLSNLSAKSEKSTKSNASKGCQRLKPSKVCLENAAVTQEERAAGNGKKSKPLSPQSVKSNLSVKSNTLKCSDVPARESVDISDSDNNEETNIKRASSSMSTCSVRSSASKTSFKSEKRTASALSERSLASVISTITNTSEVMSTKAGPLDELNSEDEERTPSVISVKSTNSANESTPLDYEKHTARPSSNLSVKSGRSVKSNVSKRSQVSDVQLENHADNCDITVVEEDSEGSIISVASTRSVKSQSERIDSDNIESYKRPPSSTSAKSVISLVSEKSAKSFDRVLSASSIKSHISAKSVQSNISDATPGKTIEMYDKRSESQQRPNSVQSSKTAKSTTSTKSAKVKEHECSAEDGRENKVRHPSGTSARSTTSAKSNVTEVSQKSKATAFSCDTSTKSFNEDNGTEEFTESRSASSMTINSAKSDISSRSGMSKCSTDIPVQEIVSIPSSPASTISIKSNSSGVFSDNNLILDKVHKKASHDRSESAASTKSKKSKMSAAQTEGSMSDLSVISAKSIPSNVSVKSTKSKASNTLSEHGTNIGALDIEGEGHLSPFRMTESAVSRHSKNSRCSDDATTQGTDTPGVDYREETVQDRAESCTSIKTSCSNVSERAIGSKASSHHGLNVDGEPAEHHVAETNSVAERADSTGSDRSLKSVASTQSKRSLRGRLGKGNSREESLGREPTNTPCKVTMVDNMLKGQEIAQRPPSTLSEKSAKSTRSSISTKSCKLQTSDKSAKRNHVENMNCTSSNSSIKSTTSRHSGGRSNSSETFNVSPKKVNVTDESTEQNTEMKPSSPISAKSVKTTVSSVSTKSKASHSQMAKEADPSERTHIVSSVMSDASLRTIQSNRSCITPGKGTGDEDTDDLTSDAKSNILMDPYTQQSEAHNNEDALRRSNATQSPVSTKSDFSEALSRSEVPSVTIEETEERSPTVLSSNSKASGSSKKSRTSKKQGVKRARKSQSSLSVHSHLSVKSKKTNVTNVSTAITVSENTGKSSRTNASRGQVAGDEGICPNRHPVVCHTDSAESDLSQTLSGSEIMKEICENSSPGESRSHGSKRKANSAMDATEAVSNKSNKGSKDRKNDMDNGDFELVPSILPNASPTEVVNEWLKTLPTDRDHYEMEELHENDDSVKDIGAAERVNGEDDAEKNKSDAQILKEANCPIEFQKEDCKTSTETPKEESSSTHRGDGSKMFNSIQVMKVLLNPKLDRCNSLPEISPVHGRKLSTSAKGLLDCLVKLRLIQHDPENANEKDERYQELMSILQSLWLSNPDEKKHAPNMNNHNSLEGEHNHTSSSGVDVNSGSTGSGKSSDGVKSCSEPNVDGSQTQNSLITMEKAHNETSTKWKQDAEKAEQEEEDSATDETITSNDSPGEPPETPASSSKSSGESSGNDKNLSRKLSQDPDPVWVLTLLNKIEKQFMTHYLSAMKELKLRWSLEDTDQLDKMIDELKIEVQNKIQTSIDKEIRKIQGRVGLPRPPTEAISRVSTKQTEERRQRLKIKLQSTDSQAEKSDSTTGTSYSDQRADNIDEYCPCETCMEKNVNSRQPLSVEVKRTAPVAIDYDLKRILLMKTTADGADPHVNDKDTKVKILVEQVIVGAIREVESEKSVAFSNTEVLNEEESEQEERYVLVKEASSEKLEADREGAKKDWSKLKRKLLPSVRIVLQGKMKQQSTTDAANNEKVTINESDQSEEEDSEAKMTAEQETKVLIKNRSSEEADHGEAVDKHPAFEVSVAQMTDVKSNKEKEVEIDKESLLEITSNAALSEDEKAAIETSSITTSGHECEKDKTVVTLTEQKSDTEEASEGTGTTSDHDSVGESGGTSDGNETEDEEEATFDDLSSIQEEEETEDELSVKREAELKKSQIPAALYENRKEKGEAKSEVQTSESEEVKEKSIVSGEHTISPVNSGDSPDENEAAKSESDEEDTTENEVHAAQVYRGSLTKSGDKTKETKRAASKHKSEEGAEGEEGTGTDEENLPAVSANESDGNRDSSTEDETSEEQNKGTTTGDENISEEETALRQNGKSKYQIAKDETAAEGTENEVSEEERTIDDGEQTGTAGESDSAEDVNDITTDDDDDDDDDESAEENDGICGELSIKQPENENKKYKQAGDEATVTATSEQQSEKIDNAEEEEAFSCEEESFKVKNRLALALTSETANDSEENKIDTDATHESDKDAVGGATGKQESETEDEPNKEKEDRLKEENTMDGTDTEEEDTGQSKSDSADALSNDETSATETKHKINKAYNALNEKEPEKRRDGDNHDVSGDTDQGSTTESSSKAVTENESEEEGSISATDDENSDNNLGEDTDETAGQEDTSTVKGYDDLGDKNLEAQCNDEILDETSQEYTDEKESLGHVEPVEQLFLAKGLMSSKKMEDSTAENQSIKEDTSNVGTCPEKSESFENESESESKQEHFSEAISKAHEDNKTTVEDSSKIEKFDSKGIETNNGEKSRSKDAYEEEDALDKAYSEEATDDEEDGSVEEKEPKCIESEEKKSSTLNRKTDQKSIKDYEKEDEDTDTPHEAWNGSLGDSADGEDEAEEDSEPEEDLIDRKKPFVADKLENLDTTKKDAKKTLLNPLEALMKERAESEDGAYADIEDSETEIHDQGDVPSIESKF
ncbi:uncharacterized protein LOC119788381 [Cyprinodon tularosa]|uniref:uncharacterized protein LOC119788381 n=1 Tax=Cyprinodon tularosa TaxID=77115 RepID=UPI0018E25ACB|nr:uncharacterized protein LOC119788381 [Cyprinodon tularosa]